MSRKRDLLIVAAFTLLTLVPFQDKAFHVDEPFFIAAAEASRGSAAAALRSGATEQEAASAWPQINNNPPMIVVLLRAAIGLLGAGERALRLAFLPFDLLAALALYLLAGRFLKKPLLPVLTVLACPAYLINVGHLMAEKLALGFAAAGLYAFVRGVDDSDAKWYWGSACAFACALLSKYIVVFVVPAALYYGWRRGVPWPRLAGHAALSGGGLALWILGAGGIDVFRGVAAVKAQAGGQSWSQPVHRLRSFFSFIGGCSLVLLAWPLAFKRWKEAAVCLLAACALFLPVLDIAPVRSIDRLTGILFSTGALLGLVLLADPRASGGRGRALWLAWIAASLVLVFNYWCIMARTALFILPALVFAWAEIMEANLPERAWRSLSLATLAAVACVGFAAASVDYRYAQAQKSAALEVARQYSAPSRTVWCAAHLGLRHYLLRNGAKPLDWSQGGWDQVKPGEIVVLSKTNVRAPVPRERFMANVRRIRVESPIPLRLISGFGGEGGFFSNISGFLPYSVSAEPIEEIEIIERL